MDWSRYKNFSRHEFDSPDLEGSGDCMQQETMEKLQTARTWMEKYVKSSNINISYKFEISRGYSTVEYNDEIGGVKDSAHLEGYAVDIKCSNSLHRFWLVLCLLKAGFKRIGVYNRHVHADDDPNKPEQVLWVGKSK